MITITSRKHGFRRCGVAHPKGPTLYEDGTFTPEQIEAMQAEPMLTVIHEPDQEETGKGKKTDPKPEGK